MNYGVMLQRHNATMRRAVVDVGSNSVLLTIAEQADGAWKQLFETSEVTGLGSEVKQTGAIAEDNALVTLQALASAKAHADHFEAEFRAYGTMALRLATNAADFLERAADQDTPVTVITGDTEAEFGFACVAEDPLFADEDVVVVDVGGHSTEVSTKDSRTSFPVGTLGLRSSQLIAESPDSGAILQASAILDSAFAELPKAASRVVGLGASVTNLVSIREALAEWKPARVHGAVLAYEEVSRFVGRSMRMTDAERAALVGIEAGRERTIHIGALIVERAMLALGAEAIYVSIRGWRHAMLSRWL